MSIKLSGDNSKDVLKGLWAIEWQRLLEERNGLAQAILLDLLKMEGSPYLEFSSYNFL